MSQFGGVDALLRPDQLELVAAALNDLSSRLGADAEPVDAAYCRERSVAFHGHAKSALVKRVDQGGIELKHRLPAGDHHQPAILAFTPGREHMVGQLRGVRELPTTLPVGADEIGVAEIAGRRDAVFLAAGPEIAAGKAQEHGRAASLRAFALQRVVNFLYCIHSPELGSSDPSKQGVQICCRDASASGVLLISPLGHEGAARRKAQTYGVRVLARTRRAPSGAPHTRSSSEAVAHQKNRHTPRARERACSFAASYSAPGPAFR